MSALWRAVSVAVLYVLAARYSTVLHVMGGGPAFWPGASLTVTTLLVSPRRAWSVIVAAVGCAELGNDLLLGFDLVPSLWWALANTLEPLVAAWLIERWRAKSFTTVGRVARFVDASFLGPAVGGLFGAIGTGQTANASSYVVTMGWGS